MKIGFDPNLVLESVRTLEVTDVTDASMDTHASTTLQGSNLTALDMSKVPKIPVNITGHVKHLHHNKTFAVLHHM